MLSRRERAKNLSLLEEIAYLAPEFARDLVSRGILAGFQ